MVMTMKDELRIEYLLYELMRHKKQLLLGWVVLFIVILIGIFACNKISSANAVDYYCSEARFVISQNQSENDTKLSQGAIESMVLKDTVIDSIANELELDEKQIKDSIFITCDEQGQAVKVQIVTSSPDHAEMICEELIRLSSSSLLENNRVNNIEITTEPSEAFEVLVEKKIISDTLLDKSGSNEMTIIKEGSSNDEVLALTIKTVIGLLLVSLVLMAIALEVKYLLSRKIRYPEEIINCTGKSVIAVIEKESNKGIELLGNSLKKALIPEDRRVFVFALGTDAGKVADKLKNGVNGEIADWYKLTGEEVDRVEWINDIEHSNDYKSFITGEGVYYLVIQQDYIKYNQLPNFFKTFEGMKISFEGVVLNDVTICSSSEKKEFVGLL